MPSPRRGSPSARTALPRTEDQIHRYLLIALGVLAGAALYGRGHDASDPARGRSGAASSQSEELTRGALDAVIGELARWLDGVSTEPATPLQANQRLLAFGRSALADGAAGSRSSPLWTHLERLARAGEPRARPAALPESGHGVGGDADGAGGDIGDGGAFATLAILLETGIALDEPLPLAAGPTPVRRLLELALPLAVDRGSAPDPWSLDLLAFAVLGGMDQRGELVRATLSSLTRLERELRPWSERLGDGAHAAGALERQAVELRKSSALRRSRDLQLSAAVFRAVAVLDEAELRERALRHLNALVHRYQLERDVYGRELALATDAGQRVIVHVQALEELGRLEQAFYGAHLTFGRSDRSGPSPRTANHMRRAARDLIDHVEALRRASAFGPPPEPRDDERRQALLRAATQALRGLRAARVAAQTPGGAG